MADTRKIIYKDLDTDEVIEDQITEQGYEQLKNLSDDIEILNCDWSNDESFRELKINLAEETYHQLKEAANHMGISEENVAENIIHHFKDEYLKQMDVKTHILNMLKNFED